MSTQVDHRVDPRTDIDAAIFEMTKAIILSLVHSLIDRSIPAGQILALVRRELRSMTREARLYGNKTLQGHYRWARALEIHLWGELRAANGRVDGALLRSASIPPHRCPLWLEHGRRTSGAVCASLRPEPDFRYLLNTAYELDPYYSAWTTVHDMLCIPQGSVFHNVLTSGRVWGEPAAAWGVAWGRVEKVEWEGMEVARCWAEWIRGYSEWLRRRDVERKMRWARSGWMTWWVRSVPGREYAVVGPWEAMSWADAGDEEEKEG